MKLKLILSLFLLLATLQLSAQFQITGKLLDENQKPLPAGTIMLLSPQDSVMQFFTTTDQDGSFIFENITKQKYILQSSYLGYAADWKDLDVTKNIDLENIVLSPSSKLISTIEVSGELIPMKIGNDTVTFNTAAFPTLPGDRVEDLLKKMPGMEVERDGSIKAFGKQVENVLVDGKSFFGSDTKIATKNLDADAVKSVEVFDKQSDTAEFTGVEDGEEQRTINLELKEDRKTGYFGNAEIGGGTDQRFHAKTNLNRFKPGEQISLIAMGNNINEQGFSMMDYIDFMGGIGSFMSGQSGGGGSFEIDGGLPVGGNENEGIQKTFAGGLNFNKDFSEKTEWTSSLFFSDFENDLERQREQLSALNNETLRTIGTEDNQSESRNLNGNFKLKTNFNKHHRLILRGEGSLGDFGARSNLLNQNFAHPNRFVNSTNRQLDNNGANNKIGGSLSWQKRFKKKGRFLVLRTSGQRNHRNNDGVLNALNLIQKDILEEEKLNQIQESRSENQSYELRMNYTEPLAEKYFLEWNSFFSNQDSKNTNTFFDVLPNNETLENDALSTNFDRNFKVYNSGLKMVWNNKKHRGQIGLNLEHTRLSGRIAGVSEQVFASNTALLPNARFTRKLGLSKSLSFSYQTSLNEPSIHQLQPVIDNTDPFNIYIGNPNLKSAFQHQFSGNYMHYDAFYARMIYGRLTSIYTKNKITEVVSTDESFRRTYRPVNVNNDIYLNGSFEFSTPINPLKIKTRLLLKSGYGKSILSVNEVLNNVHRQNYSIGVNLENRKKETFDLLVGYKWSHHTQQYSKSSQFDQSYTTHKIIGDLSWKITEKWNFKTSLDYPFFTQSFSPETAAVPLWKAKLSTFFLKENKLELRLSVFDILNQNNGINRSAKLNYTQLDQTNVLGRYAMCSLIYNLRGGKKDQFVEVQMGRE